MTRLILGDSLRELEWVSHVKPDLIVMVVRIPGMGGIEACRLLKQQGEFQDLPIILMSAQRGRTLRQEALTAGSLFCGKSR